MINLKEWWLVKQYKSYEVEGMVLILCILIVSVNSMEPIFDGMEFQDDSYHYDWCFHPMFLWIMIIFQGMPLWSPLIPPPWNVKVYRYSESSEVKTLIAVSELILEVWWIAVMLGMIERPHKALFYVLVYSILLSTADYAAEWAETELHGDSSHP